MMRLHTEARSSNASPRSGKPNLLLSRRLQLQKLRRQTKSMMPQPTRMTASQPHQSQNDLSAIQRRRSLPKGWSPSMTISMTTSGQARARAVSRWLTSCLSTLQRSQRRPSRRMIQMALAIKRLTSHLSLPWSRNNPHRTLKFPASERPTSHLKAQLKRDHLNCLPNHRSNLRNKQ